MSNGREFNNNFIKLDKLMKDKIINGIIIIIINFAQFIVTIII
jgi:hypothetical protein